MKVSIDHDVCTGHGRCYMLAPEVFDSDDSGFGAVRSTDVPFELEDQARSGVRNCPEHAITADRAGVSE
jgi:ferredoxin